MPPSPRQPRGGTPSRKTTAVPQRRASAASGARRADGRRAADEAEARGRVVVPLPGGSRLHLPSPETLAFAGTLTLLAALEVVDWPVAVAVGVGHLLTRSRQSAVLRAFAEALEDS